VTGESPGPRSEDSHDLDLAQHSFEADLAADDEQRRGADPAQQVAGRQVGSPAARDDRADGVGAPAGQAEHLDV
jgi:hypothetical protein